MINEKYAKSYCCEDLSLIENYDKAIADTTQTWDCHHRREPIQSAKDLIEIGEYWKTPAAELIFLTPSEHTSLHKKGVPNLYLKGVPKSEAHKKAIGDAKKGVPLSEATKKAIGEANSKKILQFTKSGEFIREWPSMSEASRQLKINCGSIWRCCRGKLKSAGGFVWRYATNAKKNI